MPKKQFRVSIDEEVLAAAKELGLDISRTCERALERRIAALRAFEGTEELDPLEE